MTKIDEMGFGWITVDGKKHRHDIVIFPNGEVKRRRGGILMFGSHLFKQKELEELCQHEVDVLIIGTGTDGVAKVSEDAKKFMENKKITLIELPSEKATQEFNRQTIEGKKVGAIIHVTC